MANLLTTEQKKKNTREKWLRFIAVVLAGFFVVFVVGTIFLIPTYLLVVGKEASVQDQISAVEQIIASKHGEELQTTVQQTQQQLEILEDYFDNQKALNSVALVTSAAGSGVSLSDVSYARTEAGSSMRIVGVADTREALIAFTNRLNNTPRIENVAVPISHLAERTDISFTLSFVILSDYPLSAVEDSL